MDETETIGGDWQAVSRTGLLTLRARAVEHEKANALFRDPKAAEWSAQLPWDERLEKVFRGVPLIPKPQAAWALRAHIFDQIAEEHLERTTNGLPLVVELGSGMSSRYYRMKDRAKALRWVELDLPEVEQTRKQLDQKSEDRHFVGCSVMDFKWMDMLPTAKPENVLFLAEGLFMYFEQERVAELFKEMRRKFPGSRLAFDAVGRRPKNKNQKLLIADAELKWFGANDVELSAMVPKVESVMRPLQKHVQHFGWFARLFILVPLFRNSWLIVQSVLAPP